MIHNRRSPFWLYTLTLLTLLALLLSNAIRSHRALADHTPTPVSVALAGNLQAALGCPGDWQPECAASELTFDAADDIWQATYDLPAGNWEYKVALNGSWDENYGANAQQNGPNIALNLSEATPVKFYYDHKSHWITSNQNAVIAVAPGSFQSELGCAGDWQPDCLRSWLQDPDGDGIYDFTTSSLPAGDYEGKVALNESWDVNYGAGGVQDGPNIPFSVANEGDAVTFRYDAASHVLTISTGEEPDEDLAAIVAEPVRHPIQDAVFYFVVPDRFDNGDPSNDQGGLAGDRLVTGFDPTDKGFYHGGDLAGLLGQMDYLEQLGVTAIWMTPMFKNRPVQGSGADISAGYHGYWITDFTQFDPHFGTNEELQAVIDAAHARGIKIFFDIITNHTADVLQYQEGQYSYRSKTDYPYKDAAGNVFDDRDYVGGDTFPALDAETSFPYTPVFANAGDETVKVPDWLNNPIYYHNRGNSTFSGENSLYGDFFGLDDLFTEHPDVVTGLIDIYKFWISEFDIDGFRVDTVKHVNAEFWQQFTPEILEHAAAEGRPDFFVFGEVFSSNPHLLSFYTTSGGGDMPAVLDFRFQEGVRAYVSQSAASNGLRDLFADDDFFTDGDSNVYVLPTFIGNHDMGRFGYFLNADNPGGLPDDQRLARTKLAHALMYFARGVPVVYYGDEQGFVGDGGDKDARQDMMPSQVASYNDDDLIGADATTAEANFDQSHPLYTALKTYADLRMAHPALVTGAQIHRFNTDAAGIYAFSRIDRNERVEYVVAANNANEAQTATIPTFYPAGAEFDLIPLEDEAAATLTTDANGALPITVPASGLVIYKATTPIPASEAAPAITISNLISNQEVPFGAQTIDGNTVPDRLEIRAEVTGNQFVEVTFAVRPAGASAYRAIGVDDNAPFRIFYDASQLPDGASFDVLAIVNDLNGHLAGAEVTGIKPVSAGPPPAGSYPYAIIHYQRSDGDYGDHTTGNFNDFWGLHLWGDAIDPSEVTDWTTPKPFLGTDDYGRFAWVKLQDSSQDVNFIVHRGDSKDGTQADRAFNPNSDSPEIWLKQDDPDFYTSRAVAQGYVTIHYQRPDGVYDGWGLHLWGDAIADGVGTTWESPRPFDAIDDFGAFWHVPIKATNGGPLGAVNFIIHKGDEKDPGPDQSMTPIESSDVWIKSGDETIYRQRGAAENVATIHYRRPAADYGDYSSDNFLDFWGLHTWQAAEDPGWTTPRRPTGEDLFGVLFEVPIIDATQDLGYILHRGDEKDPGPDQFLNFAKSGYEVWQLQGADPEQPYILPIVRAVAGGGDLSKATAHWLTRNLIAWDVDFDPNLQYSLHFAAEGGMQLANGAISGGESIPLTHAGALPAELQAKWPHLAGFTAFQIGEADVANVTDILKGQLAIAARNASDLVLDATGLQIPGVLDDLYTYEGELGVIFDGGVPTLRVWAPTAKSVKLHLFDSADAETASQVIEMAPGEQGAWSTTGDASWVGKYYLYEVEVFVHSTGQVEHNLVTDPYSVGLSMNSKRSLIVDLADPVLKPNGWDDQSKPPLAAPEDIVLYELHVRDFSINDSSVPAAHRGKFLAFTDLDANGMKHLRALAAAGLTHVHLLPAFDCATINENEDERIEPNVPEDAPPDSETQQEAVMAVADQDGFNWCYDPFHFAAPEGSYATDPNGVARIVEFRQMVQALHAAGLRVVMDVVYNHTNSSGQNEKSVLDKVVPGYYHRLNLNGEVETSTCCQNTATEHAMMEKLMLDTLKIWAGDYGVDGFRFDLMGHHLVENMEKVRDTLHALDPAIYIYGEGWNFGEVANNARGVNATQLNLPGSGIGTFNDRLRDAVRGGGPFDGGNDIVKNQGFISGLFYDPNDLNSGSEDEKDKLLLYADQIRVGLAGNLADYLFTDRTGAVVTGSQIDYNGSPAGYTQDPQEHIVYVAAHDNQTLYDITAYKHPLTILMADRVRAHNLGLAISVLSQGVPFIHAGEELLRSKSMDRNSYNSGDWFNKLDFTYQSNNWGAGLPPRSDNVNDWPLIGPRLADSNLKPAPGDIQFASAHVQEMLQIRRSSPLFRLQSEEDVLARLRFYNTGPEQTPGLIVMSLDDEVANLPDLDPDHELIVVLFNATDAVQTFDEPALADAALQLHPVLAGSVDEVVKEATFADGVFSIPARTTAVFVDGAASGPATITIAVDAQPDNQRNFRFNGDLGQFKLDDEGVKQRDQIDHTQTFTVEPGGYRVNQETPYFWHLTAIECEPAGQATVDLNTAGVSITVAAGDAVTCTFVNQFSAQLWVRKYHDRNGSGAREGEPGLKGWQIRVYDAGGATVAAQSTNGAGKTHFWRLRPGQYTVCETLQPGWFNSQPASLDPAFGDQPCYTLEAAPAQLWRIYFGNHNNPELVTAAGASAYHGLAATTWVVEFEDEHYEDDGWLVDIDEATPESNTQLFLPLVGDG